MTIGVFLCLLLITATNNIFAANNSSNYQPFETRDQNILNLINGQPLPTNAVLIKNKIAQWSSSLVITNTLNITSNTNESIYLDYEAYRLNLSYQYGLNENWNLKFDLPVIHLGDGFLDSAIDNWHSIFGLPEGNRPFIEQNQYNIIYSTQGQTLLNANNNSTALGDLQIAAARSLIENETTAISLWASLKLPTGDEDKISSNGAIDIAAWLALNQRISDNVLLNLNTGAVILGADNYKNIPLSDYAIFGHLLLAWSLNDAINLKAQLQGHTSYYDDSQLNTLSSTYFLTFGGTIRINNCNQIDIAVSEDIKVEASPDASFLFTWRNKTSHC